LKRGKCHLQIIQFGRQKLEVDHLYTVRTAEGQEPILVGTRMLY